MPVCEVNDDLDMIAVGSVDHSMLEEHYIEWIAVQTNHRNQRKNLKPGDTP